MDPVQITPEANQDIVKLARGVDRAEVALAALQESNLSAAQAQQLKALLREVAPTSEIKFVDGHQAVVGEITVNGQRLDTLLSEGSFNRSRSQQHADASELGYRMATCEEHLAYVEGLLEKENSGTINAAEANALKTHRESLVRDEQGGLVVDGRRVRAYNSFWSAGVALYIGALFVRTSAESK